MKRTGDIAELFHQHVSVKSKVRNNLDDTLLDDCLVTLLGWILFSEVNDDDIVNIFMAMQKRRPETVFFHFSRYVLCKLLLCKIET